MPPFYPPFMGAPTPHLRRCQGAVSVVLRRLVHLRLCRSAVGDDDEERVEGAPGDRYGHEGGEGVPVGEV